MLVQKAVNILQIEKYITCKCDPITSHISRGKMVIYIYLCTRAQFVFDSAIAWTVAHQAPLSMGFHRQEYWSGLPSPSQEDLASSGIEPTSPALQANSLPLSHQGSPLKNFTLGWILDFFQYQFSHPYNRDKNPCLAGST